MRRGCFGTGRTKGLDEIVEVGIDIPPQPRYESSPSSPPRIDLAHLHESHWIAPTIRAYMIALSDVVPTSLRPRLATSDLAHRIADAAASPEAERNRFYACADTAVRVFAPIALRAAGLKREADSLASEPRIVDLATAGAAAGQAHAASIVARGADYAERACKSAAEAAYFATTDTEASRLARASATAAAYAAYCGSGDGPWQPAFDLLDALVDSPEAVG